MAALTITAATVAKGTAAQTVTGTAGTTITAGQAVYLDASDSKYKLLDTTSTTDDVAGIALHAATDGQPLTIQTSGTLNLGTTLTVGVFYYNSPTAGGIGPYADLGSGDFVTIVGYGETAANLVMHKKTTGVAVPA